LHARAQRQSVPWRTLPRSKDRSTRPRQVLFPCTFPCPRVGRPNLQRVSQEAIGQAPRSAGRSSCSPYNGERLLSGAPRGHVCLPVCPRRSRPARVLRSWRAGPSELLTRPRLGAVPRASWFARPALVARRARLTTDGLCGQAPGLLPSFWFFLSVQFRWF
jgi:hypothetical protein